MEFRKTIFQAWKVMENSKGHGKVMENDDNVMEFFTAALSSSVKVTRLHL